jgi:TonB family protein
VIGEILTALARANLAAAVAVVLVLGLRGLLRKGFGARAAYGLWLLPLMAAAAAQIPHPQIETPLNPLVASASLAADAFVASAPASAHGPGLASLVLSVWATGALVVGGLLLRRQARFVSSLGRLEPVAGSALRRFRAERTGVGPAVVGVLRPRIVTPADFDTLFGEAERTLILAHETAHLQTGDAAVNALVCVAQCLGWFNPLVHVAARLLRVDQELACDAAVIGAFPRERRTYAELLLKTQLFAQPLPLGCHWPSGGAHPLKQRIAMLKSPLPGRPRRALGLAAVGLLSLTGAATAWASSPSAPVDGKVQSRVTAGDPPTAGADSADKRVERRTVTDRQVERIAEVRRETRRITQVHASDAVAGASGALGAKPTPAMLKPDWAIKPKGADLVDVYPPEAVKAGIGGAATISCVVSVEGRLTDCKVLDETPAQAGFGAAALKLSERFQMKPMSRDGHPVSGGMVRIPIRFALPRPPQPVTPS